MRAMVLSETLSLVPGTAPLRLTQLPIPEPAPGEVLLEISACGVCHTELDIIEGRTPPPALPVVPGHEVIGRVAAVAGTVSLREGDRVGVGWIHHASGALDENLSPEFVATGRDVDGGYAEYMTVPADYAYPIPENYSDVEAAPLLCAGAIGFRALRLAGLKNGERLGLTGFGGSAHIVLQLARRLLPDSPVHVFARDASSREYAERLGAAWVGDTTDRSPRLLRAIIDTTPAWRPVIEALSNLAPGGRLVINAIRKEDGDRDALADLSYHEHLWMEREVKSVANITARDIREFLPVAASIPIRPEVEVYPLEEANRALLDLKHRSVRGAKVLRVLDS